MMNTPTNNFPGNWHDVLQELLSAPGYCYERLANELNLSITTLKRLEQNTFRIPSKKTIMKLLSLYFVLKTRESKPQAL